MEKGGLGPLASVSGTGPCRDNGKGQQSCAGPWRGHSSLLTAASRLSGPGGPVTDGGLGLEYLLLWPEEHCPPSWQAGSFIHVHTEPGSYSFSRVHLIMVSGER